MANFNVVRPLVRFWEANLVHLFAYMVDLDVYIKRCGQGSSFSSSRGDLALLSFDFSVVNHPCHFLERRLTGDFHSFLSSRYHFIVCQQAKLILVGLFGILFNNVIYATDCSLDKVFGNTLSNVTSGEVTTHGASSMDVSTEDVILIRENPLQANCDVWKFREPHRSADNRSRRKTTGDENKLKACDGGAGKTTAGKKMKDSIDYSYIDEYCKVSAPKPSDELDSRPRELKTNTAFGRSKMPFEKFARTHIGGDCRLTQPSSTRSQLDTRNRSVQGNFDTIVQEPARERDLASYASNNDVSLRCCGHDIETAVDYCTCMFCVKGLFYHCGKNSGEDAGDVGENFSCTPANCCCVKRWSVIGLFAVVLPCILCYPAAKGCAEVCKCYKRSAKSEHNRTVQNRERERLT